MKETFRTIHLHKRSTVNQKLFTVNRQLYTAPLLRLALIAALPLLMLAACTTDGGRRAVYQSVLDCAQQQNVSFDSITNVDSIQLAADFFDRHGTPNERMRAHYLLGCAYRDMGDAPRALEYYQEATERADTLSKDCDFRLLCKIHCQMADAFSKQYMSDYELTEQQKAVSYARRCHDQHLEVGVREHFSNILYQQGKYDSALVECERVSNIYLQLGDTMSANSALGPATLVLLYKKDYAKARFYLNLMETNSNVYDKSISHESQAALLNACWGNLLLGEGKGDSARYFFSRGLEMSNDDNSKLVNLKGMYDSFLFSDNRDSIAKYAILYSNVNDSIHASLSTQSMQRIKSQYVFRQYERMAENEKRKSMTLELFLLSVVLAVTVVLFLAYHLLTRYKRKKETEIRAVNIMYVQTLQQYYKTRHELEYLRGMNGKQMQKIEEKESEILILQQKIAEYQIDKQRPELWDLEPVAADVRWICNPPKNEYMNL